MNRKMGLEMGGEKLSRKLRKTHFAVGGRFVSFDLTTGLKKVGSRHHGLFAASNPFFTLLSLACPSSGPFPHSFHAVHSRQDYLGESILEILFGNSLPNKNPGCREHFGDFPPDTRNQRLLPATMLNQVYGAGLVLERIRE
jgi:hypothetical protein